MERILAVVRFLVIRFDSLLLIILRGRLLMGGRRRWGGLGSRPKNKRMLVYLKTMLFGDKL
jgi:hypothetical protein